MRRSITLVCLFSLAGISASRAEYLFNQWLLPEFYGESETESSWWSVFYQPNGGPNRPDGEAPHGSLTQQAVAGANPVAPWAYHDPRNPTITQVGAPAFIIGPGTIGNIYSFSGTTSFVLADATSDATTPYAPSVVVMQFATAGIGVDLFNIKLTFTSGTDTFALTPQDIAFVDYIREYRVAGSSFGGFENRVAIQWNLGEFASANNLTIDSAYQITWQSLGAHVSFMETLLDTAAVSETVVPTTGIWTASGTGLHWSTPSNWHNASPPSDHGNLRFHNTAAATLSLGADRRVGEILFTTGHDVTITAGSKLSANTGITTTAAATGLYTIQSAYELGAFNRFDIAAGRTRIDGVISGGYGLVKVGQGKLVLGNNNTFNAGTGGAGMGVQSGTLRIEGSNVYQGTTSVLFGRLEVAANAGSTGALGNSSSAIELGADASIFSGTEIAALVIDGNHAISRNINLAPGHLGKRLGAFNTSANGAEFSGTIAFGTSGNIRLTAEGATDRVTFSGAMTGGATGQSVTLDGPGTVVYGGTNKTYQLHTLVESGTLKIAQGSGYTGAGNVTVGNGAALIVDGVLSGGGSLAIDQGLVGGSGSVQRGATFANGSIVSPGGEFGMGALTFTQAVVFGEGGVFRFEISDALGVAGANYDALNLSGGLTITSTSMNPFTIGLRSVLGSGLPGDMLNFDPHGVFSWNLLTASSINGFSADKFALKLDELGNDAPGIFTLSQIENRLVLSYAIPEPSRASLILLGLIGLITRRRRC